MRLRGTVNTRDLGQHRKYEIGKENSRKYGAIFATVILLLFSWFILIDFVGKGGMCLAGDPGFQTMAR
jgi:hypothetical protein